VQNFRRYFRPVSELSSRRSLVRVAALVLCASAFLTASAPATPAEEISSAVAVNGVADVSAAHPKQFLKAFTAVALRTQPRELPNYVIAAINLRSELAPNIVAVAVKAVLKNSDMKPGARCVLVDRIIRAAIAANPDAVIAIVKAAASASPELRQCVISAAISTVPGEKDAIIQAAKTKTIPFAFLTFSATDTRGFSFTAATLNPANISEIGDDSVNSPEQPPPP
jgi:hypothetical protein